MKIRHVYVIAALLSLTLSCTKKQEAGMPEKVLDGITVISVDLGAGHKWTGKERIGISGSESGSNVMFVPYASCIGTTGKANLYGGEVKGHLSGYYPYREESSESVSLYQAYSSGAQTHLAANAFMTGESDDGELHLTYKAGILHVSVALDMDEKIKSVVLSGAGPEITLFGIGHKCSESSPLELLFALPEGEYKSLSLTFVTDKETLARPLPGSFVIRGGLSCGSKLEEQANGYNGSDIEEIQGHYDEE